MVNNNYISRGSGFRRSHYGFQPVSTHPGGGPPGTINTSTGQFNGGFGNFNNFGGGYANGGRFGGGFFGGGFNNFGGRFGGGGQSSALYSSAVVNQTLRQIFPGRYGPKLHIALNENHYNVNNYNHKFVFAGSESPKERRAESTRAWDHSCRDGRCSAGRS